MRTLNLARRETLVFDGAKPFRRKRVKTTKSQKNVKFLLRRAPKIRYTRRDFFSPTATRKRSIAAAPLSNGLKVE
jgi:hypothetical protein